MIAALLLWPDLVSSERISTSELWSTTNGFAEAWRPTSRGAGSRARSLPKLGIRSRTALPSLKDTDHSARFAADSLQLDVQSRTSMLQRLQAGLIDLLDDIRFSVAITVFRSGTFESDCYLWIPRPLRLLSG